MFYIVRKNLISLLNKESILNNFVLIKFHFLLIHNRFNVKNWLIFSQSLFRTIAGTLSCLGCPLAIPVNPAVARASCKVCRYVNRFGREAVEDAVTAVEDESRAVTVIDDAPRTAKMIIEEADLNKDGVLDVTEAAEYLVYDGKLHIQVKQLFHW